MKFTSALMRLSALVVFSSTAVLADPTLINGAGATFPFPLYSKWFSDYRAVDASVEINYQSIGSGGGIRQLLEKSVDFGASDAPMTDAELAKSSTPVLHIPTVLGAVVATYHLPGLDKPLRFSSQVLADIFLGKITDWSHAKIAAENPGVKLPKLPMLVAYRSDGSGTTSVFTDYLAKASPEFAKTVGSGKSVKWPTGLGGKGNEGVTGLIKQTPGAVGYVEHIYAESNKLPSAVIKNQAGNWVAPSMKAVTAAAEGALKTIPADFRVSITNAAGKDVYPISSFTYLLVYQKMDALKGKKLVKFLNWALADGQKTAAKLTYAPLPKQLVAKVRARIQEIKTE